MNPNENLTFHKWKSSGSRWKALFILGISLATMLVIIGTFYLDRNHLQVTEDDETLPQP